MQKKPESFAIVIPARNEEATIGPCLHSVQRAIAELGGVKVDVVVIDDGSSDRTSEIASGYGVRVISKPVNEGVLRAWKTGVDETSSDVVIFVDADCTLDSHALVHVTAPFSDRHVGVTSGRIEARPATDNVVVRSGIFSSILLDHVRRRMHNSTFIPIGRLMAVRREAFLITQTDRLSCDLMTSHLAKQAGYGIVYCRAATVHYAPVTTFRALRNDWLRTRVSPELRRVEEKVPLRVKAVAGLWSFAQSPVNGAAWLYCQVLLRRSGRRDEIDWSRFGAPSN